MKDSTPQVIHLEDYAQPHFWIDTVDLVFELGEETTRVLSTLSLRKNNSFPGDYPLVLNGEHVQLGSLRLDGADLGPSDYAVSEEELTIHRVPEKFERWFVAGDRPDPNDTVLPPSN